MIYQEKTFYLCKVPLSAEGSEDVEIITRADDIEDFPRVFKEFEDKRSHAFNNDGLYSVIRADDIFTIIRTTTPKAAKTEAFEESTPHLITNLQHRVMQDKDQNAKAILKKVHEIETDI